MDKLSIHQSRLAKHHGLSPGWDSEAQTQRFKAGSKIDKAVQDHVYNRIPHGFQKMCKKLCSFFCRCICVHEHLSKGNERTQRQWKAQAAKPIPHPSSCIQTWLPVGGGWEGCPKGLDLYLQFLGCLQRECIPEYPSH